MRSREISVGRAAQNHVVDVDLTLEVCKIDLKLIQNNLQHFRFYFSLNCEHLTVKMFIFAKPAELSPLSLKA